MVTTLVTIPQSASTNMPPSASTTLSTQSPTPSTQPGTDPRAISPDIQHPMAAATPNSTAQPTAQPAPRRTTRPPKSVQILNLHTALLPTPPEIIPTSVAEALKNPRRKAIIDEKNSQLRYYMWDLLIVLTFHMLLVVGGSSQLSAMLMYQ